MARAYPSPKHAEWLFGKIHKYLPNKFDVESPDFKKQFTKAIQKALECKVVLKDLGVETSGECVGEDRLITVDKHCRSYFSTVCHELVHLYCYDKKLYFQTHHHSQENIPLERRTAVKAERFVESVAEQLFWFFFPDEPYNRYYGFSLKTDRKRLYAELRGEVL